jgi:hypothetical protein
LSFIKKFRGKDQDDGFEKFNRIHSRIPRKFKERSCIYTLQQLRQMHVSTPELIKYLVPPEGPIDEFVYNNIFHVNLSARGVDSDQKSNLRYTKFKFCFNMVHDIVSGKNVLKMTIIPMFPNMIRPQSTKAPAQAEWHSMEDMLNINENYQKNLKRAIIQSIPKGNSSQNMEEERSDINSSNASINENASGKP